MFDYFKKIKSCRDEQEDASTGKQKKDKVFIGILILFGIFIVVSVITGITDLGSAADKTAMDFSFKFGVGDGIMLGGITIAYIVTRIRKGRK